MFQLKSKHSVEDLEPIWEQDGCSANQTPDLWSPPTPVQQVKGVSQNINYTTIALLPVLTSLFDHIAQHQFGDDVMRESATHDAGTLNTVTGLFTS